MTKSLGNIESIRVTGSTSNYKLFVPAIGNRDIQQGHVLSIMESMQLNGNISAITCREITVDGENKLEVMDGQHRLEALKLCQLPVEFDIWKMKKRGMIALNEHQKNWKLEDYLNKI